MQAVLLSHLDGPAAQLLDPEHDTQRAINCLLPFLKWFRQHFQAVPPPASTDGSMNDFPYDAPTIHAQVSARREYWVDGCQPKLSICEFIFPCSGSIAHRQAAYRKGAILVHPCLVPVTDTLRAPVLPRVYLVLPLVWFSLPLPCQLIHTNLYGEHKLQLG